MAHYTRRQIVEAIQYSAGSGEAMAFLGPSFVSEVKSPQSGCRVMIDNGAGSLSHARHGDWLVKAGTYIHVMPNDQFHREFKLYEPAHRSQDEH